MSQLDKLQLHLPSCSHMTATGPQHAVKQPFRGVNKHPQQSVLEESAELNVSGFPWLTRKGFVVERLLEYNPAPAKEPLCETKHSCVERSTSSYWKGDGRRFKQTIHTPPHVCLSYSLHIYFGSLLSRGTAACFLPAAGHLNPAQYPLLLTCPKSRFRFCFGSQKKKRILHILVFDRHAGQPRNVASPSCLPHI